MDSDDPFAPPPGFSDDEIPVIGDHMLEPEVDFEAGMSPWPPVSIALMAACLAAFVAEVAGGGLQIPGRIVQLGALSRPEVEQGEAWRMLSCVFLHGSPDHLLGNLLILYILGMACEHAFGRYQFLTLFVAAGLVGSAASLVGGRVSVGASGAIFGLAGATVTTLWRHRARLHLRDRRIGGVLAVWAVYQVTLGMLNPAVDNLAHVGGLLGGGVLGLLLRPAVLEGRAEVGSRPTTIAGFALAMGALGLTAGAFLPRLLP